MKALRRPLRRARRTTSTNAKVEAMVRYLAAAPAADAAWAVFFLTGRRLKRLLPYRAISDWTLARDRPRRVAARRVLRRRRRRRRDGGADPRPDRDHRPANRSASPSGSRTGSCRCVRRRPRRSSGWSSAGPRADRWERFTLLKLLTGELRVGVSQTLVGAGAGPGGIAAGDDDRGPHHGRVDAVGGVVRRASSRPASPTPIARGPIRSASPRPSAAPSTPDGGRRHRAAPRRPRRLAGRVEVGRHPRPARRARRPRATSGRAARS